MSGAGGGEEGVTIGEAGLSKAILDLIFPPPLPAVVRKGLRFQPSHKEEGRGSGRVAVAHGNFSGVCGVSLADKLLPLTSAANTGPSAGVAISFRRTASPHRRFAVLTVVRGRIVRD